MAGLGRKVGIVGFLLSVGVACTQLFGNEPNTIAPIAPSKLPTTLPPMSERPGTAQVCAAGDMRCEGAALQTCSDDLASWVTVQRCAAAALCQKDPAACLAATCGVDEMTCQGSVLQKCNADRTGWDLFATCLSPAHCNADLRQCMSEACNPGDRRCDRSEVNLSPVLEVCNDARQDWTELDACVTRELCDQTLSTALSGGLVLGSDGQVLLVTPTSPSAVVQCNLPACATGEVRCDGSRLEVCAEGRTGWTLVEECASDALCSGSLTNVNAAGAPQCLLPACAVGQHSCTPEGVLQVCSEDRTGFRTIQACLGPPFCSAVLADQGQEGCRSAPCEAGEMQCNGAQIQVCKQDRTGLDDTGAPCESPPLCNQDDPANAFCEQPACRRGATSGDEFRCEERQLERCKEDLTGYDPIQTCVTAALCDAGQRSSGCRPPVCQPGDHKCTDAGLLQTCNPDQTAFEDSENCGSLAQCDDNAGRCSDPCEPGTARCNAQSGDLQECRDRLSGWQTIGDCVSLPLCDAANRRCNPPVCQVGERHCETRNGNPVIMECAPGRNAFVVSRTCAAGQICDAQNNECDVCAPNTSTCDGDTLVRCDARGQAQTRQNPACGPGLCSAAKGRCLVCDPINSARCVDLQLRVCAQGQGDNEFERSENCDTSQLCNQTLTSCGRGLNGQNCQCTDRACTPNQLRCNAGQIQRCNAGLTGFDTVQQCANGCNPGSTVCNECNANTPPACLNGQVRRCVNGFFQNDNCNGLGCSTNTNACNACSANANPPVCQGNGQVRRCVNGQFQNDPCSVNGANVGCSTNSNACNACSGNTAVCQNNQRRVCVNGQFENDNCNGNGCSTANNNACNACSSANNPALCQANGQVRRCLNGQFQNDACTVNGANVGCSTNSNACNACSGNAAVCENNQVRRCVNGQFQTDNCNGLGCDAANDTCNACSTANNPPLCQGNGQVRRCVNGQFQNDPCSVNNVSVGCSTSANPDACNACANNTSRCTNNNAAVQRCVDGQFATATACSDNNVCNGSETCANGSCGSPGPAANRTPCGNGQVCNGAGACVPDTQCDANRPCPGGDFCVNGRCVECTVDADCDDGNACNGGDVCASGVCRANNQADVVCPTGQTCNPSTGACVFAPRPECTTGGQLVCFLQGADTDGSLSRCSADRTQLLSEPTVCTGQSFTRCVAGRVTTGTCNGTTQNCIEAECRNIICSADGAKRCQNNAIRTCGRNRTFEETFNCAANRVCTDQAGTVSCLLQCQVQAENTSCLLDIGGTGSCRGGTCTSIIQ